MSGAGVSVQWGPSWTSLNIPGGAGPGGWDQGGSCMVRFNASWEMVTWGTLCGQTDRHDWKYYLPATSLADGNNIPIDNATSLSLFISGPPHYLVAYIVYRTIFPGRDSVGGNVLFCSCLWWTHRRRKRRSQATLCVGSGRKQGILFFVTIVPFLPCLIRYDRNE